MTGFGVSAYRQAETNWETKKPGEKHAGAAMPGKERASSASENAASKIQVKSWSPIDTAGSLVPRKTEYGMTIGDVQLSDQAKSYYDRLKSKFHNMEFIAVSKDMKAKVQQNAAAYGNAGKMVVLIDEEKLERMATDESFRKKYEGIIAMSQSKLEEAKNSLTSAGTTVKNFGMSVDANGRESFFATVEKSLDLQKKRIEKKAAEKKEQKIKEHKKAEKKAQEERIERARDKNAEAPKEEAAGDKEFVTFEAHTLEELLSKVREYTYENASSRVMTDAEKMLGTMVDYKG